MDEEKKKETVDLTMGLVKETPQVRKKRLADGTYLLVDRREEEFLDGTEEQNKTTRDLRAKK